MSDGTAAIGIRREDKNRWERRVPLTPDHVEELVRDQGRRVVVQPSPIRVFPDAEYEAAGAEVREDLSDCRVILAVKEIPTDLLLAGKAYAAFFHVIKGQPQNMPMLRRLLELKCTVIDYERIVDRFGRRLIFFGRHAGYAGIVDGLWALGRRLAAEGIDSAFAGVRRAYEYPSVEEAARAIAEQVGQRIRDQGVDPRLHPLVVGFTGGGNVSQGAQEVFDRLPVVEVLPGDLPTLAEDESLSRRAVYKVVFRRDDRADFARWLPHLTMLVNGIFWPPDQPRLVTRADVAALWGGPEPPKLRVLADLSCDFEGSIEVTVRAATIDDPVYVVDAADGGVRDGVEGRGPVVLAVDNLPAEFPRDASEHFGDALFSFLHGMAVANYGAAFEHLALPAAILGAVVAHAGELTPAYRYIERHLAAAAEAG
jgi:alpha-aminoadipic semialdehyde synthase